MSTELAAQVKELANARRDTAQAKVLISIIEDRIAATDEGKALQTIRDRLGELAALETEAEKATRDAAIVAYDSTAEKKPHPAITIKSYTVLDYDDAVAFDYAIQHLPGALKFNKTPFEKVAKVAALDFVTISTEMRPTIASDLSEYED